LFCGLVFIFYQRVYELLAIRSKFAKLELVKKFLAERGVMKFVVRRAVVGLLALPLIAGAYVFVYLALEVLGAGSSLELREIWNNGLLVGSVSALAFAFATQLDKFITKIVGV
jgi:hypothetical protein